VNLLQSFIQSRQPGGYLRNVDIPELIKLARLCPVLVRCGGCRFVCGSQDAPVLEKYIVAGGDYVRDVSFTGDSERYAAGWTPERVPAQVERCLVARATPKPGIKTVRGRTNPDFRESDCGGVFDGFGVVSDADPGL
jgi:hypothetical protein